MRRCPENPTATPIPGPVPRPGAQNRSEGTPAFVENRRLDVLAVNRLGHAMYAPMFEDSGRPANFARFTFFNPRSTRFYRDWDWVANTTVAILRTSAGRDPYDKDLSDLIGELSTRSEEFRTRWARHNVRLHQTGLKHFHHPVVGDLALTFDALELAAAPGLRLIAYTAEPGSASEDALNLLASWAATLDQGDQDEATTDTDARTR
ncbi:hypothetical protein GCM10011581_43610 [Saccharopolyspora subtropica]|uniref:MmyB-like transcription regulator ligand binding domain-containing protein n=1 Tax=Saccharopolyspora thermophila TaxID=89367 RepID=A0A917K8M8_9PSEU|nr:hypothetical protein [Saccharopolyspora subtropica]GGJ01718.1 hypothetical protein GCM10011581_43610 [Saccharopolyspora subtropica]